MQLENKKKITRILKKYKHIAIVGLSANPLRPSYSVAKYLQDVGYIIYPVNPHYTTILNQKCHINLNSIPNKIEIVNIFRRPEHILPIVEEAIRVSAKVIWMQLGIRNERAADLALEAGMEVIMNRCIKIDHLSMT
jgi:predicted CoA-binding protein